MKKQDIITALEAFINQRPGLEYGNYGEPRSYRAELRSIGKDLKHARELLRAVEHSPITAEQLVAAFDSFSGRLSIKEELTHVVRNTPSGKITTEEMRVRLDYCTGQYWPTEYRRAVCAVCASALWYFKREELNAQTDNREYGSLGDEIRAYFRRSFGRGIQSRWFN